MHAYSLYGLEIASALALDAPAGAGAPEVTVRWGDARAGAPRAPRPGCYAADAARLYLFQPGVGYLLARGGRELVLEPLPEADEDHLRAAVLGRGLAAVLHQRGVPALHASAVALGGRAVAFVGAQGQGKSTAAAALVRGGGRLVTDDLLPISLGAYVGVHPGPAQLRLWPASVEALGGTAEALPRAWAAVEKRCWGAPAEASQLQLAAVCELAYGDPPRVERLPPRAAFVTVVRNAFADALARSTGRAVHYHAAYAELVRRVPVYRLTRPRDLTRLEAASALVVALLEDASASGPPGAHADAPEAHRVCG